MPKIVDKTEKRREIIQAAMMVFAEEGTQTAKMATIARKAGIGKGTIYEYFSTKEELIFSCIDHFIRETEKAYEKHLGGVTDPIELIHAIASGTIEGYRQNEEFFILTLDFWAMGSRGPQMEKWKVGYQHFREMIKGVVQKGIENGRFKSVDAELNSRVFLATLDGIVFHHMLFRDDTFDFEKTIVEAADRFIDSIHSS